MQKHEFCKAPSLRNQDECRAGTSSKSSVSLFHKARRVVDGMQTQATGLHRFVHPLVRKKVFDRKQYGTFLAQAAAHSRVNSGILVIDTLNGRQRQGYPARNELFGADLVRIEQTVDAAAVRVSHHDDVMHLKMLDAVLDGGDHRIVFAGGILVRNNGGNATDDKQVTRLTAQNDGRVGAGIATGDDKRLRTLPMRQLLEKFLVLEQVFVSKAMKSRDELVKSRHNVRLYLFPSKKALTSLRNS